VAGDEVARDERAEGAGAARDQDGALAQRRSGVRGSGVADAREARRERAARAQRELRLVAEAEQRRQRGQRGAVVEVGEDQPAGVLGLGGADEPPHGGGGHVGRRVGAGRRDRAARDDDEPGARERRLGQPALHERERPRGGRDRALGAGGGLRARREDEPRRSRRRPPARRRPGGRAARRRRRGRGRRAPARRR
jgi:hypothetical protein